MALYSPSVLARPFTLSSSSSTSTSTGHATKLGLAGCCCGHPPPNNCTSACIYVTGLGGTSLTGLTVKITFTNPGSSNVDVSGTPDSNGQFCADAPPSGNPVSATVTTPLGATLTVPITQDPGTAVCVAYFEYCEDKLIAYAYDGDAGDTGPGGGMAATLGGVPGFAIGSQVADGSVVAASGVGVVNHGTYVEFTRQTLTSAPGYSAVAGTIPNYVAAYASGYYGHSNCCFGCVNCGQVINLPIVLWSQSKYVWNPTCDPQCTVGIARQNGRFLVTPKKLYATFTGPEPIFGTESGVSVTLNWDPSSWDGRVDHAPGGVGPTTRISWTSDCSSNGAYGGCYTTSILNCFYNEPNVYHDPVLLNKVFFGSRKISVGYTPYPATGFGHTDAVGVSYGDYWNGSCQDNDPAPVCHGSVAGGDAIYATTFGFCPWTDGAHIGSNCPPYAPYPPPSGPQDYYPQGVATSWPLHQIFCGSLVAASQVLPFSSVLDACSYSVTVAVSE